MIMLGNWVSLVMQGSVPYRIYNIFISETRKVHTYFAYRTGSNKNHKSFVGVTEHTKVLFIKQNKVFAVSTKKNNKIY